MRLTHYDKHKKRWQINDDYGAVMIDELNYAVGEAIDKLADYEDAEEQGRLVHVVRCGECKHWFDNGTDLCSCDRDALLRRRDFFCADGERRYNG